MTGPGSKPKAKLVTPEEGRKGCSVFMESEQDFLAEKLLPGRLGRAGRVSCCTTPGGVDISSTGGME